jgi:putative endonuclease
MFFVYMVASEKDGTLYVGHTDDLAHRITEHRVGAYPGFSRKYRCKTLVWFESHNSRDFAFRRERQIKEWKRAWKIRRIKELNPDWYNLYPLLSDEMVYDEQRMFARDHL